MNKQNIPSLLCTFILLFLLICLLPACNKNDTTSGQNDFANQFNIRGPVIYQSTRPVQLIGSNAFHVFGPGGTDMNNWHIDIAREFIGNIKEVLVSGGVILDANGSYLHSLQELVDSNRKNNRITILTAFGWDGTGATQFTGKRPSHTSWWIEFKLKLAQWSAWFKDQNDVWIEVWNEPYRYDRADGYTDDIWFSDMNDLVNTIRNTSNNNIILVPCAEQGQDESVLINKGAAFLANKQNILFDIHAYEKWLMVSNNTISYRMEQLKQNNLPVMFGEVAPLNASVLMDPMSFLDSVYIRGLSICAWVWKYDGNDKDALLNNTGLPNNNNNNNWGSLFRNLSTRPRKP